eukprot:TRINITY_DN10467_c0_g1_i1.p1 TRINITY_DN10467_c0_g1~~TRINITY_DN10467_c0_g1_i1.p1  ORF type:complete len:408 (+),score=84.31 TRINITY_DN10467_c0_g1_i1:64-1224(+)
MYRANQTPDSVSVVFVVPPNTKSKDVNVVIGPKDVVAGLKGAPAASFEGGLYGRVVKVDSLWFLEGTTLTVNLEKAADSQGYWPVVINAPHTSSLIMDPHSTFVLSSLAEEGLYVPDISQITPDAIYACMKDAADRGSPLAQLRMGYILAGKDPAISSTQFGMDIIDKEQSTKYFLRAADDHQHPEAMLRVADAYQNGTGVSKDLQQAETYASRSADANNPEAMYMLGNLLTSLARGEEGRSWWSRAVTSHGHAPSCRSLGYSYWTGENVQKDLYKAQDYFSKAASLDSSLPFPLQLKQEIDEQEKAIQSALRNSQNGNSLNTSSSRFNPTTNTPKTEKFNINNRNDNHDDSNTNSGGGGGGWGTLGMVTAVAAIALLSLGHFASK